MSRYTTADELAHTAGDDPDWQESAYVCWFDGPAGLAGFHRIGHQVPAGEAMVWCGVLSRDGARFRRSASGLELTDADREGGFGAGPRQRIDVVDGRARVEVNEDDLEVHLVGEDFYPVLDLWTMEGAPAMSANVARGHFEASGRYTGTVRLGGRRYEIDGVGHRDRSWGVRRWDYLTSHRWCAGTFGPELSWSCFTWHAEDGSFSSGGFLVRDGVPTRAEAVDICVWLEADGLSFRGGELRFLLPDGDEVPITLRTIDGIVFDYRNVWEFEAACEATCGPLTGGFAALEATNNALRGRTPPSLALRGTMVDGLTASTDG